MNQQVCHALMALGLVTGSPVIGAPRLSEAKITPGPVRVHPLNSHGKGEIPVHAFGGQSLPRPAGPVSLKGRMTAQGYEPENHEWMDILTYRDPRLGEYSSGLPRRAGHDPMNIPPEILTHAGHPPRRTRELIAAIEDCDRGDSVDPSIRRHKDLRNHCLACDDPAGVRLCTVINCPFWPYRMGKNPHNPRRGKAPAGYWAMMRRRSAS
jgi:hypothetical protein